MTLVDGRGIGRHATRQYRPSVTPALTWLAAGMSRTARGSSSSSRPRRRRRSPATSATGTSSSRASATSATSRARGRDPGREQEGAWARLGVDVDTTSSRSTSSTRTRRSVVADLKQKLKDADELLLATDEDREGEAIAWHLLEVLQAEGARRAGWSSTRSRARRSSARSARRARSTSALVDAQETRRILDRLYGYEVSPVLWKKVMQRLSAAACSPSRPAGRRARARADGVRRGRVLGPRGHVRPGARSRRGSSPVDGKRVARAATSAQDGHAQGRRRAASSTRTTRAALAGALAARAVRRPLGRARSRTRAGRRRRS